MDNRNVRSGDPIPVSNYSDQPYVVKTDDGGWLMVVTTGAGTEGSKGQHITSAKSFDCGKTWSDKWYEIPQRVMETDGQIHTAARCSIFGMSASRLR